MFTDNFVFGSSSLDKVPLEYWGVRRMFYNKIKGAFRAGIAYGNEWDDVNVGFGSIGLGLNNTVTGEYSIGIGYYAGANALGAVGINGGAEGEHSVAISANATGEWSVAIGSGCLTSGQNAVAFGNDNQSSANYSSALGYQTTASGDYAISLGNGSTASGTNSFVLGKSCTAVGEDSFSLGTASNANGKSSLAIGTNVNTGGDYSIGLGNSLTPRSYGEMVFGFKDEIYVPLSTTQAEDTDRLFVVANGFTNRHNAITVLKNGKIGISRIPTTNILEVEGNASKTTSGDWLANSDRRLKKEIETYSEEMAFQSLLKLRGVTYLWNDDKTGSKRPEGIQYGFIAQEIQEVFPENVQMDNLGYYQTAYGTYDAMYVQAIKALYKKIENLENKNQKLTNENNKLQKVASKINIIENRLMALENASN